MSGGFAPAHRKEIARVERALKLTRLTLAVQRDQKRQPLDLFHGRRTNEVRILRIDGLQLLTDAEFVRGRARRRRLETRGGRKTLFAQDLHDKSAPQGLCLAAEAKWRLEIALVRAGEAKGMQPVGVTHEPEVAAEVVVFEVDSQTWSAHFDYCTYANGRGVSRVERLESVAYTKFVRGRHRVLTEA